MTNNPVNRVTQEYDSTSSQLLLFDSLRFIGVRVVCPAGAQVVEQGQELDHVTLLEEGTAALWNTRANGDSALISIKRAPWAIGPISQSARRQSLVSIVAVVPCAVRAIPIEHFSEALRANIELSLAIHQIHECDLREQLRHIVRLAS